MIDKLFSKINYLNKSLDGAWLKHEAISNNIANVNTPGYKKTTVDFESVLKDTLSSNKVKLTGTNKKHITHNSDLSSFSPLVESDNSTSTRADGNNVNIDVEMGELAKNSILYNSLIQEVSKEFQKIRNIINEGGR